jgi:hypothetical protein
VTGNVLDGHTKTQQVKYIVGETIGVADAAVGERNIRLDYLTAFLALVALDGQRQEGLLAADRQVVDVSVDNAILDDVLAPTMRTFAFFRDVCFELYENCTIFVRGCTVVVLFYAEGMIQEAGIHIVIV